MGKRQVGELQPFDLAVTIMISELAAFPMQNTNIPLINSVLPIFLILALQIYISALNTKSIKARELICGKPTILIENGRLNESELKKHRINLHELLTELRVKGYPNLTEIEFAFLETNGKVSVIPKSQNRPVTPKDLELDTDYEGVPHPLIVDGQIYDQNLAKLNLSREWLENELSSQEIENAANILFASLDQDGSLYYQRYQDAGGEQT
jgi:uncharacterized membrane protein YcaP (DUF421 family)